MVLTQLALTLVSSMNTSLSGMLTLSGWRVSSLAARLPGHLGAQDFAGEQGVFMAEAKPLQPCADRPAMHRHAMHGGHSGHDPGPPIPQPAV